MIRWGAPADQMGPLKDDAIFSARLKALIIMTKAFLKGYPLGDRRRTAIIENARWIFYHLLDSQAAENPRAPLDHLCCQRVQLLAVMAQGFAAGNPVGAYRQKAIASNLAWICDSLAETAGMGNIDFLKVA